MKKKLSSSKPCYWQGINYYVLPLSLVLLLLFQTAYSQVHLVKDINQSTDIYSSEFAALTDVNGILYFVSKQNELWKTDGTTAGSVKVKTFKGISQLQSFKGELYFFASDETYTYSLWKSDGMPGGTVRIKQSAYGSSFTVVNDLLFFIGSSSKGNEVWRSDGTDAGTFMVKDIMKGSGSSNSTSLVSFNNKLFFVANNGTNGYEIWSSDGTLSGTNIFKDIIPGKTSSAANYLTVAGNTLFFMARDAALGEELWKSDGTSEGTVIVKDIYPGSGSSFPSTFISVNQNIFFRANDGKHNFQLWRSDGTAEGTIKLTTNGFSWINGLLAANNNLYYLLGRSLYKSDGTVSGTQYICAVEDFYTAKELAEMNGSLYIMGNDYYSMDLWKVDGSHAVIVKRASVFQSGGDLRTSLTKSGNNVYFVGNGGDDHELSLWKSDGTAEGTVSFLDLFNQTFSSYPYSLTDVNGELYFDADDGGGTCLWKSDGTESGTQKVSNIYASNLIGFNNALFFKTYTQLYKTDGTSAGTVPVSNSYVYPENLTVAGSTLYFSGDLYPNGYELWKTDGTQAGTVQVKDIYSGTGDSSPQNLTNVNGTLYFAANDGITGVELWKSDGSAAGTVRVKDINLNSTDISRIQNLTALGSQLFFTAFTPEAGIELWKSDGTESGTVQVKDINTDDTYTSDLGFFKVVNNVLFFTAIDAASGWALWKSDGTTEGTVKVKDFYPGLENIIFVNAFNNELYLLVSDADYNNNELWKSNGTESGTVLLTTIGAAGSSQPSMSVVHNGVLYIDAANAQSTNAWREYELWRTDGTTCGTHKINYDHEPQALTLSGSNIFFSGLLNGLGVELLKLDESEITAPPCSPVVRIAQPDPSTTSNEFQNEMVTQYPNPFQKSFSLNVKGKENANYSVKAMRIDGVELEKFNNLKCNRDYTMGANWNAGMYVIKINADNKMITKKIIKID
jgi:ELWxxDGT repeat protein